MRVCVQKTFRYVLSIQGGTDQDIYPSYHVQAWNFETIFKFSSLFDDQW